MSLQGTFAEHSGSPNSKSRVYIGVKEDISNMTGCWGLNCIILAPVAAVDLVFSAVLDTVFLPYTIFSKDLPPDPVFSKYDEENSGYVCKKNDPPM
jgi:uncharacterized protein YceK